MRNWLTIELLVSLLLATSFATAGLVALWAATSPRHWFIRTGVLIAFLALPLLIPAYEPLIVFSIQSIVVVAGIQHRRRWMLRQVSANAVAQRDPIASGRRTPFRFGLSTLLLITPVVAVIAAISVRVATELPPQNLLAWRNMIVAGLGGGCAVLIGSLMLASTRKLVVWPMAVVLLVLLATLVACQDWIALSLTGIVGWPPNPTAGIAAYYTSRYGSALQWQNESIWLGVIVGTGLTTLLAAALAIVTANSLANRYDETKKPARPRIHVRFFTGSVLTALLILLAAYPSAIFWRLLHPAPLPNITLPSPNGFDEVTAAATTLATSPILSTSVEPKSTAELRAEIAKYAAAYDQLHRGLQLPIRNSVWPAPGEKPSHPVMLPDIQNARQAAHGMMRESQLAREEGRFADAAKFALDAIHLGQEFARDGLYLHYIVGIAIEQTGEDSLYQTLSNLDATSCRQLIDMLQQIDREREPLADVLRRDQSWTENAEGWGGHLVELLQRIKWTDDELNASKYQGTRHAQAITRLLAVELAIRAYKLDHGALPDELSQLLPDYLAATPIDPFDPAGGTLHYVRTEDNYILYSFGQDHDDDGGRSDRDRQVSFETDGDLRLDVHFAPDPPPAATNASDNADNQPTGNDAAEPEK